MANVVGQRVRRREDPRFLTGRGSYVDDQRTDGALYVQFVRSYEAHARILEIDTSEALAVPGTQVFTAADCDLTVHGPPPFIPIDPQMFRPFIASEKVTVRRRHRRGRARREPRQRGRCRRAGGGRLRLAAGR